MSASITSIKDEHIALARSLDTRTRRQEQGRCLLEGATLIEQAVRSGASVDFALRSDVAQQREPGGAREPGGERNLDATLLEHGVRVLETREGLLRQAIRTQRPVEWLAVASLPATDAPYGEFALVLDNVLDPGNLGSLVRTACGLGTPDVVCTDPEMDLTSRKVVDASRAAVLRARIHRFDSPLEALDSLRESGFEVVATSPRGRGLDSVPPLDGRVALVAGNETNGSDERVLDAADRVVRIPMAGRVESLNVGVATGICVHELRKRQGQRGLRAALADASAALESAFDRGEPEEERALADLTTAEREQLLELLGRLPRTR